ncbi:hypothetical protein Syun_021715 [Stephania yunnanensis]|uniref:Uncharacterized protein n=1 Tax=Stephania yunnanensis TaxID=152371 RepID=A0AAP0IH47_9MAGN
MEGLNKSSHMLLRKTHWLTRVIYNKASSRLCYVLMAQFDPSWKDTDEEDCKDDFEDDGEEGDGEEKEEVGFVKKQVVSPQMGMTFNSHNEAHLALKRYAKSVGFRIKISSSKRLDDIICKRVFACYREGQTKPS